MTGPTLTSPDDSAPPAASGPAHVVVVGGGVSGLALAHALLTERCGLPLRVTVLEADGELGGKIRSREAAGLGVDVGPDALLVATPATRQFLTELGLDGEWRAPATRRACLWTRGALRPIPPSSMFGVPERLAPLLRSGLVSPAGLLRAGADLVLPATAVEADDPTIGQLLRPRLGGEAFDHLVDPLVGGIYAGRADELSARSVAPGIAERLLGARSAYLELRPRHRRPDPVPGQASGLVSFPGGLARIVGALRSRLRGATVIPGVRVSALERTPTGVRVVFDPATPVDGRPFLDADHVVLATPAAVTADLVHPLSFAAYRAIADIPSVDVATAVLALPGPRAGQGRRPISGFLVPPRERRLVVGATMLSAKWSGLAQAPGGEPVSLLRVAVGRSGDTRVNELDDAELLAAVRAELGAALGPLPDPVDAVVQRWPAAMPQYTPGHAARVGQAEHALAAIGCVSITGAAYHGIGVASCVAAARTTADTVRAALRQARAGGEGAPLPRWTRGGAR